MPGSWSDFLKLRSGPAPAPSPEAGAVRVYADSGGALRTVQSDGTDAAVGGGGGPAFNGGTITDELVIDTGSTTDQALELQGTRTSTDDVFRIDYPHTVLQVDSDGGIVATSDDTLTASFAGTGEGTGNVQVFDARADRADIHLSSFDGLSITQHGTGQANINITDDNGNTVFAAGEFYKGIRTSPQLSGALPTTTFASGTGTQVDVFRDRHLVVPFTGDATNNAATLLIQLSPDDVTYSTLDTLSIAAALNLTGALNTPVSLYVPAGWYVKLTATHGTIGTGTYY